MRISVLVAVSAFAGAVAGCFIKPGFESKVQQVPPAKTFETPESLGADLTPYDSGRLILAGTPVPVKLSRRQKGIAVEFDLKAQNEVLEVEHYVSDQHGFRFAGISDETFEPPLPIVRYPFEVGETWQWSGEAGLGKNRKTAKADLSSGWETVNLAGGVYDCVVVSADLVVTAEGTDSKRKLKFWIQPKKGIIKREFGFSSTREPKPAGNS